MMRKRQLRKFRERVSADRQGVEVEINGKKYLASIRKITTTEAMRLQGVPMWYNFGDISDTQVYKLLGNGWQIDVIKHCWQFLPNRPLKVWSLFDGMSCAYITLKELGIPVQMYISSEVDAYALKAEKLNFPDMIQVGSVTDIDVHSLVEKYGVPDLLCGGSPCQSFSFSGKRNGMTTTDGEDVYTLDKYLELKAEGFEFSGQSYLFWEYMRILKGLQEYNPDILFFLENVEMQKKWEGVLSTAIGMQGVHINAALVSPQSRKRIYWSNIRTKEVPSIFGGVTKATDIPIPADRGMVLGDITDYNAESKYYFKNEKVQKLMDNTPAQRFSEYLYEPQFTKEELRQELTTLLGQIDNIYDEKNRERKISQICGLREWQHNPRSHNRFYSRYYISPCVEAACHISVLELREL